jgi:hypothetical protein
MPVINNHPYADHYDCIFVGTSALSLMEALCQIQQGNRVLMIDDQPQIGGVWVSLELFGLHDVENAIHYFIYDKKGIDFMQSVLRWNVIESPKKFRVFPNRFLGFRRIPYDSAISLIAARILEAGAEGGWTGTGLSGKSRVLIRATKEAMARSGKSHYFAGGTPDMMRHVKVLAQKAPADQLLNTLVEEIRFDPSQKNVRVQTSNGRFSTGKIFITHGSRLNNLYSGDRAIKIDKEKHRRPQIHLLVNDSTPANVYEGIFVADPLIKYVHDITRFTKEAGELAGQKKLYVVALQHDCENTPSLYTNVLEKLKIANIVSGNATLENTHWYESYLPELSNATLEQLKNELHPMIDVLMSDNFCGAIGLYSERWKSAMEQVL